MWYYHNLTPPPRSVAYQAHVFNWCSKYALNLIFAAVCTGYSMLALRLHTFFWCFKSISSTTQARNWYPTSQFLSWFLSSLPSFQTHTLFASGLGTRTDRKHMGNIHTRWRNTKGRSFAASCLRHATQGTWKQHKQSSVTCSTVTWHRGHRMIKPQYRSHCTYLLHHKRNIGKRQRHGQKVQSAFIKQQLNFECYSMCKNVL